MPPCATELLLQGLRSADDCAQVWPICGDGLRLEIRQTVAATGQTTQLMAREILPDAKDKPQRQKVCAPAWMVRALI